tara:strand:+ start:5771 stop:7066 length:1296 start_codon:yes stop_codon:yes gene_type:complete
MAFFIFLVALFFISHSLENFYNLKFFSLVIFHLYSIYFLYKLRGLNVGIFFASISFFYIITGPADVFFWDDFISNNNFITYSSVIDYSYKSTVFFIFFYLVMMLEKPNKLLYNLDQFLMNLFNPKPLFVFIFLIWTYLLFNYAYEFTLGNNLFNRLESYATPNKIFDFTKIIFLVLSIFYFSICNKKNRNMIIMIIIFALLEVIIFGNRRLWLLGLLPIIYLFKNKFSFNFFRFNIIAPIVCILVIAFLLPLTRGFGANVNNIEFLQFFLNFEFSNWIRPGNSEFIGVHIIHSSIYQNLLDDFSNTFFTSIYEAFPSFIVNRSGEVFSTKFVTTYFPDISFIGGGFRGSLITEIFLNFSYIGLIFFGIFFGKLFSIDKNLFVLNALLIYIFAFSISYDFVLIFQQIFLISIIILFFYLINLLLEYFAKEVN